MCDTFVALPDVTLGGELIFGKNSDRPSGEVQDVVAFPVRQYAAGDTVRCTYLQIPQARQTFAVILSKPRWMWGAEMGANEHGVVIGNEAVWTTEPYAETGLLGMDLVNYRYGSSIAATPDGSRVIVGADGNGDGGSVSVYDFDAQDLQFYIAHVFSLPFALATPGPAGGSPPRIRPPPLLRHRSKTHAGVPIPCAARPSVGGGAPARGARRVLETRWLASFRQSTG